MGINYTRVVTGGLAAGVVLNVVDFIVNNWLLKATYEREFAALNAGLAKNMESVNTMIAFIVCDFITGFLLVWLYAAIRPRFGPGGRTSLYSAILIWLVQGVVFASLCALGMFSWNFFFVGAVATFVSLVLGAYAGGMVYSEAPAPA